MLCWLVAGAIGDCGRRLDPNDKAPGGTGRAFGRPEETGGKIRTALEKAGIEFIDENGGGPGVRLQSGNRKKASRPRAPLGNCRNSRPKVHRLLRGLIDYPTS